MKKNGTLKISNNLLIITSVGRNDSLKNTHTIIFRKFWAFELFFFWRSWWRSRPEKRGRTSSQRPPLTSTTGNNDKNVFFQTNFSLYPTRLVAAAWLIWAGIQAPNILGRYLNSTSGKRIKKMKSPWHGLNQFKWISDINHNVNNNKKTINQNTFFGHNAHV